MLQLITVISVSNQAIVTDLILTTSFAIVRLFLHRVGTAPYIQLLLHLPRDSYVRAAVVKTSDTLFKIFINIRTVKRPA